MYLYIVFIRAVITTRMPNMHNNYFSRKHSCEYNAVARGDAGGKRGIIETMTSIRSSVYDIRSEP